MSESLATNSHDNKALPPEHNEYPAVPRSIVVVLTVCICLAVLLLSLDRTIVAVVRPKPVLQRID